MSTKDPLEGFRAPDPVDGADQTGATEGGEPAPQRTEAEVAADEAKVEAAQAYKSDPRNDIYARHREARAAEQAESDVMVTTARAEGRGLMPPPEAPPSAPAGQEAPVAPQPKSVKIVVYGQEREVPEAEVLQAGVATLQKDAAADQKLSTIARREQELRSQEAALLQQAERIRQGLDPITGLPLRTASQPPSPGAAPPAIGTDVLKGVVETLYLGDTEKATKALQTLVTQISERAGTANPVPADIVASVEQRVLAQMDQREIARRAAADADAANQVFKTEFADVVSDPVKLAAAKGVRDLLLQDPEWQAKSRAEVAREVGNRVRSLTAPVTPPVDPAAVELQRRNSVKRTLPAAPQGGGRAPAPVAPKVPTNSEYIEQLRKNSGSNSAR